MNDAVRTNDEKSAEAGCPAPRVVFVGTDLSTGGGVNKVIRDLAIVLRDRLTAQVTVVSARSDRPPTYTFPGDVTVQTHRRRSLLSYFWLLTRLRRSKPDFVIGSWTQDNILLALAFLRSPTRIVLVEHTSWYFHGPLVRMLRRLIYPLAWRVVVLNRAELDHYRTFLGNVRLLPNPVPKSPPAIRQSREKLILAVGHLEPRKNFADAIRAMALSGLEQEGWSLVIIGEGPQRRDLLDLIGKLGLQRTRIEPPTQHLGSSYARSSLTLVTARLEVFSLVLAEAMLAGVVPIAYAVDGPSFVLEDFPDLLVPPGNVESLAARLKALANVTDLGPLRRKVAASIEARFSPETIGTRWSELLSEAAPCQ